MIYPSRKDWLECGVDEAGRGCLAGPVACAAVILKPKTRIAGLNDSKQLSVSQRDALRQEIENHALAWKVVLVPESEIAQRNILWASVWGMQQAVLGLSHKADHIWVDGNRFRAIPGITHSCIVKGDSIYACIAAASILAKTHRDAYMEALHSKFPCYNWSKNKGYPTADHRQAITSFGICQHHRAQFKINGKQLELFR